jgi:hypothetical protein
MRGVYKNLHREYRELQRAYEALKAKNKYDALIYKKAKDMIIARQGELLSYTGCCFCPSYEWLAYGHSICGGGRRNRMAGHPTPNLKGI